MKYINQRGAELCSQSGLGLKQLLVRLRNLRTSHALLGRLAAAERDVTHKLLTLRRLKSATRY